MDTDDPSLDDAAGTNHFVEQPFSALRTGRRWLPPDIVLVVADGLGCGDVGAYGGPPLTPRIDRMARSGVRFTGAYAASTDHNLNRRALASGRLPATGAAVAPLLAEVASTGGYDTSLVGAPAHDVDRLATEASALLAPRAKRHSFVAIHVGPEPHPSRDAHLASVGAIDALVGSLVRRLRANGQFRRTVMLLVGGSAGDELTFDWAYDVTPPAGPGAALQIPAVMTWPAELRGRQVDPTPMSTVDWAPTLARLMRVALPAAHGTSHARRLLDGEPVAMPSAVGTLHPADDVAMRRLRLA